MAPGQVCTHILILNFNGQAFLADCLPSILLASSKSQYGCGVTVVDNGSSDGSAEWVAENYSHVPIVSMPNLGLASFNEVVARRTEPVLLLLNNDIKLDPDAIDPLVETVLGRSDVLFAAPKCWSFDGRQYEGMRTRVRTRFGMVQGLCRVPGHEQYIDKPGVTASAGPVLAIHRERFLEIGGYDPIYWPGRIEDLDLGFRGWLAGYRGYYVPQSLAYHKGFASFGPAFGQQGCDHLAVRNTLLFCWRNLRGRRRLAHLAWLGVRLFHAGLRGRREFIHAVAEAARLWKLCRRDRPGPVLPPQIWIERQEGYFRTLAFEAA